MNILYWIAGIVLATVLGAAGGYVARGDCAKEVRATEATATAKADVKAEKTVSEVKLSLIKLTENFDHVVLTLDALPPEPPVPAGCPARELSDDELRLWNAGNQDGHLAVQPAGTHDAPRPAAPAGEQGRP